MFTCNECNKIYTYKANYIRHIDIKHKQMNKNTDTDTDTEFIIINNSYFDKNNDKDTIIKDLKKKIEEYTIKYDQLQIELKKLNTELNILKENKDNQLIDYFMKYKVFTYSGIMIPSKYNYLFFKK